MFGSTDPDALKFIMVPVIAAVVIAYGVVGGLAAAYWTDLIQGLCIIVLSLILIPYGLSGLVEKYGDQYAVGDQWFERRLERADVAVCDSVLLDLRCLVSPHAPLDSGRLVRRTI